MTAVKERITITLDPEVAAQVRALAGDGTVSAVVEKAVREMLDRRVNARARLTRMVEEAERKDPERAARARAHMDGILDKYFPEKKEAS